MKCNAKKYVVLTIAILAVVSTGLQSEAATVTIEALDVRANGVFGHDPNVSGVMINGLAPAGTVTADPINVQLTYANLDLDGDSTANDSVTFTLTATGGTNQRIFNQGIDTGFGSLNDVTVSVSGVSGTTTDSGAAIMFDGFTGAAIGAGSGGLVDRSADINGTTVSLENPSTGGFQFLIGTVDFAATPTVLFDNSGGTMGSVVARHYDLQFSVVPEPSTLVLSLLLGAAAVGGRRG